MAQLYGNPDEFVLSSEIPWSEIDDMNGETNVLLIIDDQMLEQGENLLL